MLPVALETDPAKVRKFFEIRAVPAISPTIRTLRHQTCVLHPFTEDGSVTYYAIRSAHSSVVYDVLLPVDFNTFAAQYAAWVAGAHCDTAFKCLNAGMRRFVTTGITVQEWKHMNSTNEDER